MVELFSKGLDVHVGSFWLVDVEQPPGLDHAYRARCVMAAIPTFGSIPARALVMTKPQTKKRPGGTRDANPGLLSHSRQERNQR